MRIAFFAPLKGPDHPVPSGDRQMARLLMRALRAAGHAVEIASTLRTFEPVPDPVRMRAVERLAEADVRATEARWSVPGVSPPDVWFTYHPFYKAPDLLGPHLVRRFGMVYATAEASNAPKRAGGPWAAWHDATEAALSVADIHFCFTDPDREGIERLLGRSNGIVALPPFIDASPFVGERRLVQPDRAELVAVAMMRAGDKLRSFAFLAAALAILPGGMRWHLTIVGDGPARAQVEEAFASFGSDRVSWRGQLDAEAIGDALRDADLLVWPGFNEAYGVSYLEAGAAGLPALAMRCGGIPSVIRHGETGWLVPEGDLAAYAAALAMLIGDSVSLRRLGEGARRLVTGERSVARAAAILDAGLRLAR